MKQPNITDQPKPVNPSKLTPYRLPLSILVFFIAYALLTRTPLSIIPESTSSLIASFYAAFDAAKETEQVTLIYALLSSVVAHFGFGKLCKIESKVNQKGLLKGLGALLLIIAAYGYNLVQQAA